MRNHRVKFQPSSIPPTDRFWWGVLLLLLVVLVTGVKQSQLLVLRLSLEFDKNVTYLHKFKDKNAKSPKVNTVSMTCFQYNLWRNIL